MILQGQAHERVHHADRHLLTDVRRLTANAAWLALACVAFNVLRAAGAAASPRHAKARWATLRTHLIAVPARVASSARRLVLHLPTNWPWGPAWQDLWATATAP